MSKLTKLKELYIGKTPWGLAVDEDRHLAYVYSDPYIQGFDNKITCIGYENGDYKVLNSKILSTASESMCVNSTSGLIYFSYIENNYLAYGVRIIDPYKDYEQVGFIAIPVKEQADYIAMFENMTIDRETQQLFIATGPQVYIPPYSKGYFQYIQCDTVENKFIQSVDNYISDEINLSIENSSLDFFDGKFMFCANPDYGAITSYNVQSNKVTTFRNLKPIYGKLYITWDVAVDRKNKKLYAALQSNQSNGLLILNITDMGLDLNNTGFIGLPSELGQFNILFDRSNNVIYAIPNNDLEDDERGKIVICDLKSSSFYISDVSAQADSVVFDEKNRRLYIADESLGTVSIYSVD